MFIKIFRKDFWRGQRLLLAFLIILHVAVSAIYISYQDLTIDEGPYYNYTVRWAHKQMERNPLWDDSKTPATFPAIIPRIIYQLFHPGYLAADNGLHDMRLGRYCMCLYTIIIACYLFSWCRRLFGDKAWLFPVLFFLFNPLVLGYSMLIISDMASGACMVATLFHAWMFYSRRAFKHMVFCALWLGLGIMVKASFLFMLPCLLILLITLIISGRLSFNFKMLLLYSALTFFIIVLVLNVSYFGTGTFQPLSSFNFKSMQFRSFAEMLDFIKTWHIPVPRTVIESWDLLQYHKEIGGGTPLSTYGGVYILGETHLKGAVWYYYLVTAAIKFPVAIILLLIGWAGTSVFYFNSKSFLSAHVFYALPIVFFLIILSCLNSFQNGLRHLLLVYPLLMMGIAAAIFTWRKKWRRTNIVVAILFVYMVASQLYYYPNLIPYTNEFLTNKKMAFRITIDCNLDYGQYHRYENIFLSKHTDYSKAPIAPREGKFILAVQDIFGMRREHPKAYNWILKLKPAAHYKFSFLLFDVSKKDLTNISNE